MEKSLKGEPVKSPYEKVPVPNQPFAYDIKCNHTGKITERRWWSTCDEQKLRDAILLLICSDYGFNVDISGPAFNIPGAPNNFLNNSVLSLIRSGYGSAYYGPKDYWTVLLNGVDLEKFDDPTKAIDFFISVKNEYEVGHDMAYLDFCGHGTPKSLLHDQENC